MINNSLNVQNNRYFSITFTRLDIYKLKLLTMSKFYLFCGHSRNIFFVYVQTKYNFIQSVVQHLTHTMSKPCHHSQQSCSLIRRSPYCSVSKVALM